MNKDKLKMSTKTNKVVILFEGRCGSSNLTEILNQHPEAAFFGELLSGLAPEGWARQKEWLQQTFSMKRQGSKQLKMVGFKTKLRAIPEEMQAEFMQILIENDVRIIRMYRRDLVRQAVSASRADNLVINYGIYNVPTEKSDVKVGISPIGLNSIREKFRYFNAEEPKIDDFIMRMPDTTRKMVVSYEEYLASREDVIRRVFDFSGIDYVETNDMFVKNTENNLRHAVSNYDELKQWLTGTRYQMRSGQSNCVSGTSGQASYSSSDEDLLITVKNALLDREPPSKKAIPNGLGEALRESIVEILEADEFRLRNAAHLGRSMQPNFLLPDRIPEANSFDWRPCDYTDFLDNGYSNTLSELRIPAAPFRKYWEYVRIIKLLSEKGKIGADQHGLGIDVEKERLPAFFARMGCKIGVAGALDERGTLSAEAPSQASSKEDLFYPEIVDRQTFEKNVYFLDGSPSGMKEAEGKFDFIWSTTSIRKLSDLGALRHFVEVTHRLLKPTGIAIHAAEFNLSSTSITVNIPQCHILTKDELVALREICVDVGYSCPGIYLTPTSEERNFLLSSPPAVRKQWGKFMYTSLVLWMQKGG